MIVDAETGRETDAPTDVGHRFAVEIREQFVHVVEGLCGIGTFGDFDRRLLHVGQEEKLRGRRRMRRGTGRLHHAESDVAFIRRVARRHAGAIGRAHEVGRRCGIIFAGLRFPEVEAATAHDAKVSVQRTGGIGLRGGWIGTVPIGDPLGRAFAHDHAPRVGLAWSRRRVAGEKWSLRARALGVLPLGFGGQTVGLAGLLCEPRAEGHGLVVADACGVVGIGGDGFVGRIELLELLDGDEMRGDGEGVRDGDAMRGDFVEVAVHRAVDMTPKPLTTAGESVTSSAPMVNEPAGICAMGIGGADCAMSGAARVAMRESRQARKSTLEMLPCALISPGEPTIMRSTLFIAADLLRAGRASRGLRSFCRRQRASGRARAGTACRFRRTRSPKGGRDREGRRRRSNSTSPAGRSG